MMTSLKEVIVNELHKGARKHFTRRKFIMRGIDETWQVDLLDMQNYARSNANHKYLLTCIDCFSKFAFAVPIKDKTGVSTAKAMESIFQSSGRRPVNLMSDFGREFYCKPFKSLMTTYNINHYSSYSDLKCSIVERFNRTLRQILWKMFSMNGDHKYYLKITEVLKLYNSRIHSTIKMAPENVTKSDEHRLLQTVYNYNKVVKKSRYRVGDFVRISKYKKLFEKSCTGNWGPEIFQIERISRISPPEMYYLVDYQKEPVRGGFYAAQLQKVTHKAGYLIEKILKKRGQKLFVKFLGFNSSHNQWVDADSIDSSKSAS